MTTKPSAQGHLSQTIGLYGAVALSLGIVIGAGMLSLPGLVYAQAGGMAWASWLMDAALVLPLLFVFALLGRNLPNAGGVAGFIGAGFPRLRMGTSFVLIGTFGLGLPAIALSGAGYLLHVFHLPTGESFHLLVAGLFLGFVLVLLWGGSRISGRAQNVLTTFLVALFMVVILFAIPYWPQIDFQVNQPDMQDIWSGAALAFFAYTGWEMLSFITEEFKNPKRDFPLALAISFVLITTLYVGLALAVQAVLPPDAAIVMEAPLLGVVDVVFHTDLAWFVVGLGVIFIIIANLNAACWGASRLIYDTARRGWTPAALHLDRLSNSETPTPRRALLALASIFALVLTLFGTTDIKLDDLLRLAAQNFFLLYLGSIIVFFKLTKRIAGKILAILCICVCLVFSGIYGWGLLYALALFIFPYIWKARWRILTNLHRPWRLAAYLQSST